MSYSKRVGAGYTPTVGPIDERLRYPGVYLLAYGAKELEGQNVKIDDVYYIGMSNSAGGVRSRLRQFKSALERGYGHSGGNHCYVQNKR
jgi:hypothetical protein